MSANQAVRYFNLTTNCWEAPNGLGGAMYTGIWAWQPSSMSMQPATLDATGALVTSAVLSGSAGNAAAGTTGVGVPSSASLTGWSDLGTMVAVSAAKPMPVSISPDTYLSDAGSLAVSGNLHVTTGGRVLRLFYYMLNADPANTGPITVSLQFATGGPITKVSLVPGAILARNIGAGKYYLAGAVGDNLSVTITGTGTLNWATEFKEV